MKNYTQLSKVSFREYKKEDFPFIYEIFCEFLSESEIRRYTCLNKNLKNKIFIAAHYAQELKKEINMAKFKYVCIDENTQKIMGFWTFYYEPFHSKTVVNLSLAVKSVKYKWNMRTKYITLRVLADVKHRTNNADIYVSMTHRDNFNIYKKWMKKVFKLKSVQKHLTGEELCVFPQKLVDNRPKSDKNNNNEQMAKKTKRSAMEEEGSKG